MSKSNSIGDDRRCAHDATTRAFVAGSLVVKLTEGQISEVCWNGERALSGVTFFLRDSSWVTRSSTYRVSVLKETRSEFRVRVDHSVCDEDVHFDAELLLVGNHQGYLEIKTTGEAKQDFETNRIGLTLLHPEDLCRGLPLTVTHSNKKITSTNFPNLINPSQPVLDICKMDHNLGKSAKVEISFDALDRTGQSESFEMEDQRNWGDASYKTYVGSLMKPWPFQIKAGNVLRQSVILRFNAVTARRPSQTNDILDYGENHPSIGLFIPRGLALKALENVKTFGCFRPDPLSFRLHVLDRDSDEIAAIKSIRDTLDCPLLMELEADNQPETSLAAMAEFLEEQRLHVDFVLPCPEEYLESYQPDTVWPKVPQLSQYYFHARRSFPSASIGGGMLTLFTELNRKWPNANDIDFVAHSFSPTVHVADDDSVIENIQTIKAMAETVKARLPGVDHRILAATLAMRENPYGDGLVESNGPTYIAMMKKDPRQGTAFAAVWAGEVLRVLARTDVVSVGMGALAGPSSIFPSSPDRGEVPIHTELRKRCDDSKINRV